VSAKLFDLCYTAQRRGCSSVPGQFMWHSELVLLHADFPDSIICQLFTVRYHPV